MPTALATEFRINTHTDLEQIYPSVAGLANGNFVVTWQSQMQDSSMDGIYGQLYSATGTTLGSEFQVNTYTHSIQVSPSVAGLTNGNFIVTWQGVGQDDSTGIYGQLYQATGAALGDQFRINTLIDPMQLAPAVAGLSNGDFVTTWQSSPQDGSGYGIYGQLCSGTGVKLGSEFRINTHTSNAQIYPSVVGLSNGNFVVTWQSAQQDGSDNGVYGQLYDDAGTALGAEFQVNTYTNGFQGFPSVAGLTNGGFVITWDSDGQDGSLSGVYGQVYDASATKLGSEFRINTYTDGKQFNPSVAGLSNGHFMVTWQSAGQDGSGDGIYGQLYNNTGNALGSEFQINTYTTDHQWTSSVAGLTNGNFVVTWASLGQDGSTVGVYGQRFSLLTVANFDQTVNYTEDTPTLLNNPVVAAAVNDQASVTLTLSVPAAGQLSTATAGSVTSTYQSSTGVWSASGPIANINTLLAGVKFIPVPNGYANVAIQATISDVEATVTSNLNLIGIAVNDVPVLVNNRLTIAQAQTVVLSTSQLSASDDTTPANALQFTVSNVQRGQFRLMSAAATSFTQQNIIDGNVSFVHDGTATAPSYTVIVSDGSLTSSPQAATITFNATPILVNNQLTIGQAQTVVLTTSQLSASDDNALANALQFTVSDVQRGQFRLNGVTATSFTQQNIIDGKVTFVQDGTATAPSYTVSVSDGDLTSSPQAASITFNAAPVLVNNQLTIGQAQTVVLSTSQLSASDDTALASALQFTVSDVQHGQFSLNGAAATSFTQQDITEGKVSFVQDGTATAPSYTVIVSDGNLISSSQAANITFNAAPVLVNNQLTVGQAQTVVLSTSQLSASDDITPANALQFTVSNVQNGQFRLMGVAATRFTQQDILEGNVTFVQDGTATAPSYTVIVSDGNLTSAPQTASITFNRMPVLSSGNQTISYYSRTAPVIIDSQLNIQDADSPTLTQATVHISQGLVPSEDELSVITPASLSASYEPTTGVLQLTGNATVADYQQTLRQVAYRSQADVPTTHPRTLSFSVFDGLLASQPVNCSLSVIQVNRAPLLINPRSELAVRVNQPFSLSVADTFRDPDQDELTLGLLPTDGQELPDWLNFDASRQVLSGKASTQGSYNFTLFANDTAHAQARMPMTLVAKVVTNNALILGTALGLGLSGSLVLLCCLGILVTAGAIGIGYERKLSQQQALSRKPHRLADLLRKELRLQGVADFTKPTGQAYVNQVNYLITYDEVLFQLYIRCSNDKQLPSLAKELAKLIKLHFKEQKIALQANLLQKETPKMMLSFHQQEAFFTAALNRAGYQDLLAAPIELKEVATPRELNPP